MAQLLEVLQRCGGLPVVGEQFRIGHRSPGGAADELGVDAVVSPTKVRRDAQREGAHLWTAKAGRYLRSVELQALMPGEIEAEPSSHLFELSADTTVAKGGVGDESFDVLS